MASPLTVGLVDANEKASKAWAGLTSSVVAGWPLADTTRWKIGNVYRGRMAGERQTPPLLAGVA